MKTRMEKYARYRMKILNTPDEKFENKKMREVSISKDEKNKETPYTAYHNNEVRMSIFKASSFAIAIIAFVLLYWFWVRG